MAKKYLDNTGLTHLWDILKTKIPTKTSDLTNDSGYLTSEALNGLAQVHVGTSAPTNNDIMLWVDTSLELVSFSFKNNTLQAIEGADWNSWIKSVYNTIGISLLTEGDPTSNVMYGGSYLINSQGSMIYGTDTIIPNESYTTLIF